MILRLIRLARPYFAMAAILVAHVMGSEGEGAPCATRTIGVDTTHANVGDAVFNGRAWSQVFLAEDTLISAIYVWRAATPDTNLTPVKLYILESVPYVYGADTLIGPDPSRVLLDGPQVSVPYAPDQALPMRFDFNPPLALPRRGTFAFAMKDNDEFCRGGITLLFDSLNTYAAGNAWKIAAADYCLLGLGVFPYPQRDFVFGIEFCSGVVDARRTSWGRVKSLYR